MHQNHLFKRFRVLLFALMLMLFAVGSASALQECYGEAHCYGDPQPETGSSGTGGGYSGSSDGRLNPTMDEYYAVWCKNNVIEVWGGSPSPVLIESIPLVNVLTMTGPYTTPNYLNVNKVADVITISGWNGNNPNGPGSKWFTLSDCLASNGSIPEIPPTAAAQTTTNEIPVSPCAELTGAAYELCYTQQHSDLVKNVFAETLRMCSGASAMVLFVPSLKFLRRKKRTA